MKYILRIGYRIYIRITNILKLPFNQHLYNSESYYPEHSKDRKTIYRRFLDQFNHIIKYGSPNNFYFSYGLDISRFRSKNDYVDYRLFMNVRNKLNNISSPHSIVGLLRNKFLFSLVAESLNIPTPENIGVIEDGMLFIIKEKRSIRFIDWLADNAVDVFIKSIGGECGDGVFHLVRSKDGKVSIGGEVVSENQIETLLQSGKYVLQKTLIQHSKIAAIHPNAVNTIRLTTIYDKETNDIKILPPLLRVGVGENNVDNWAMGGLAIGINIEKQSLKKYGFYKPGFGTKATFHPNSKVVFEGYEIPYLNEAIAIARRYHSFLTDIHSIGWDIAISEKGPIIIEGNDNWEISIPQICSHGLNSEFNRYFR